MDREDEGVWWDEEVQKKVGNSSPQHVTFVPPNPIALPMVDLPPMEPTDIEDVLPMIRMRDFTEEPLEVLSYGGGVQSTAMLILIRDGILPKPDIVIFSDTGSEMRETIDNVHEFGKTFSKDLGIPFAVVTSPRGRLHEDYHAKAAIPVIGNRSCTGNFKIAPQRRFMRKIVGNKAGVVLVNSWLGITTDEEHRRTVSDVKWTHMRYPMLDEHRISRQQCLDLLKKNNMEVIKSGCFMCPYNHISYWKMIEREHPDLWEVALKMEEQYRANRPHRTMGLFYGKKWLKDLHFQASFEDYFEGAEDIPSCDSPAGCFI